MSKPRDQKAVNNVTLYILSKRDFQHGLTTVPVTLGMVRSWVGRKTTRKDVNKAMFFPVCRSIQN